MNELAEKIVAQMLEADAFSQWLGIRVLAIKPGYCKVQMQITPAMCNGFKVAHGGIAFSVADSACSFAINAAGRKAMSADTSITQFKALHAGDIIHCFTNEESLGKKLAVYTAEIFNQDDTKIALFKGIYYRSDKKWLEEIEASIG